MYIDEAVRLHTKLAAKLPASAEAAPATPAWLSAGGLPHPAAWNQDSAHGDLSIADLIDISRNTGISARQEALGKTTAGLQELIVYGLKVSVRKPVWHSTYLCRASVIALHCRLLARSRC